MEVISYVNRTTPSSSAVTVQNRSIVQEGLEGL